jgi:hypothetical protein
MHRRLLFALSIALALASQPTLAAAQSNHVSYEATDPATGWRAVMELRFLPERVVVAVLFQPTGGYRVFLGGTYRGGLNIQFAGLKEVSDPLRFLIELDPNEPRDQRTRRLVSEGRFLPTECQIGFYPDPSKYNFSCSNGQGTTGGRLRQLP